MTKYGRTEEEYLNSEFFLMVLNRQSRMTSRRWNKVFDHADFEETFLNKKLRGIINITTTSLVDALEFHQIESSALSAREHLKDQVAKSDLPLRLMHFSHFGITGWVKAYIKSLRRKYNNGKLPSTR